MAENSAVPAVGRLFSTDAFIGLDGLGAADRGGVNSARPGAGEQMAYADRVKLIKEIEGLRESKVVCYLTSVRPNVNAQISDDAVRVMFDQMLLLPERPVKKLDIFLCSNGGAGTVPWRLVSLFREYATSVAVLLPYRAYSAATLLALGADEIVMHPFAEMGPIDPTVSNDYNPIDPATNRRVGISVEDVKAYISFIKSTVGIQHEDELVKTVEILAQKVHPLALGNVERFLSQSRLIAAKILKTHMQEGAQHQIEQIIENLASKLYFHGHPINRAEARRDLQLKIMENPPAALETAMWKLYEDFEAEFENRVIFDPMAGIYNASIAAAAAAGGAAPAAGAPPTPPHIVPFGTTAKFDLVIAAIEGARRSSQFRQETRFVVTGAGPSGEPLLRQETLAQGWKHSEAPTAPQN